MADEALRAYNLNREERDKQRKETRRIEKEEKERQEVEKQNEIEARIRERNPIGHLISNVVRLINYDKTTQDKCLEMIKRNGQDNILMYDTAWGCVLYNEFYKQLGYENRFLFGNDLLEQSKHERATMVVIDEGPFTGWCLWFFAENRRSGPSIHAHGYSSGSSQYVYSVTLRKYNWREYIKSFIY